MNNKIILNNNKNMCVLCAGLVRECVCVAGMSSGERVGCGARVGGRGCGAWGGE